MNIDDWNGIERRSAPLHLVKHFDEKLRVFADEHREQFRIGMAALEAKFDKHVDSEEVFWKEVNDKIDANAAESRRRHEERMELLGSISSDQDKIKSAFIRDAEGEHDFSGHHDDHLTRRNAGKWWRETFSSGFRSLVMVVLGGLGMFVFMAAWEAFKAGLVK